MYSCDPFHNVLLDSLHCCDLMYRHCIRGIQEYIIVWNYFICIWLNAWYCVGRFEWCITFALDNGLCMKTQAIWTINYLGHWWIFEYVLTLLMQLQWFNNLRSQNYTQRLLYCCGLVQVLISFRVISPIPGNRHIATLHDDVIKWKHFRVTCHLCGEFTGHRWIPRTKASNAELWSFLWSKPE